MNFSQLTKFRLSITVVISSIAGYFFSCRSSSSPLPLLLLIIGGYAMVGASNAFNQVFEKDLDKLMLRTQNRPLPAGRMQSSTALFIGVVLTLVGVSTLYLINLKTAFFCDFIHFLVCLRIHPIKAKNFVICICRCAFSCAIPFMLGWVAATNEFGIEPGVLFMIQFLFGSFHIFGLLDG